MKCKQLVFRQILSSKWDPDLLILILLEEEIVCTDQHYKAI